MSDPEEHAKFEKIVNDAASSLGEHFDSVRIFVTWPNENSELVSCCYSAGRGNFFAQVGHIRDWMICDEERTRRDQIKRDQDEDDGDE